MSKGGSVQAVVPIKGGDGAKRRLSPALSPALRRALALAMAEDVLGALAGSRSVAGTVVVTADAEIGRMAARYGAQVLRDGPEGGYTAAVSTAAAALVGDGVGAMLCVPGDVPLLTPRDVDLVVAEHQSGADFVIVPAHDLVGTNAVLCAPPDRVTLRFGGCSFDGHLRAARRAGIEPRVLRLPGIELDVDLPADLERFMAEPSENHAYRLLREAGLAAR